MITTEQIKELREKTGISIMQCKKALEDAGGDMEKAIVMLKKKGAEIAAKKSERTLGAGIVECYVHNTKLVGSMVELLCESDFVAKNEEFVKLARDIAMHVSATNPEFLSVEEIPEDAKETAKKVFEGELAGKPEEMKEKILQGKLASYFNERVLLDQPFIKNPDSKIRDIIEQAVQKFGEKIEVKRFVRFSIN
ncbi:MAG: elongation factor Ts [Candidatus Paceibacterota bacterium]